MCIFQLDLNKMPLGKLSKKQLQKAYAVLTEATQVKNANRRILFTVAVVRELVGYSGNVPPYNNKLTYEAHLFHVLSSLLKIK